MDNWTHRAVQSVTMPLPLVYHPDFVSPLPPQHRFPMPKFGMIYQMLVRDGIASTDQFHVPEPASSETLSLAHQPDYVQSFLAGTINPRAMRRIGLPWSESLAFRTRAAVGGTLLTARLALEYGIACSTAGGTHHAHPDYGSGYCIFNDLAVTALSIIHSGQADRILIVDLDVHQGDGTAAILASQPAIFTFSMHCDANFPFRKFPGDRDVALDAGTGDDAYIKRLRDELPALLADHRPDLVLYDAGVDPHAEDRLGKLSLSTQGLFNRDRYVIDACVSAGAAIACVVGGGYDRNIDRLARRHCLLHRAADEVFTEHRL